MCRVVRVNGDAYFKDCCGNYVAMCMESTRVNPPLCRNQAMRQFQKLGNQPKAPAVPAVPQYVEGVIAFDFLRLARHWEQAAVSSAENSTSSPVAAQRRPSKDSVAPKAQHDPHPAWLRTFAITWRGARVAMLVILHPFMRL